MAEGIQAQEAASGLADAKVKEADAIATEKHGLAQVRVKEAEAVALQKLGGAEAAVIREKLVAEADGIAKKAESMKELDTASREHEEFRLRVENERLLGLESIKARLEVEQAKARILGAALENAKIDIVGGDGQFLDRVVNSIGLGKSIDSLVAESETAQAVLAKLGVKDVIVPKKDAAKVPVVKAD
jgi:hypothetical protein